MKQDYRKVELRTLTPEEGMWLTQKGDPECRIFSKSVTLGAKGSPDDWTEWPDDQKTQWEDARYPKPDEQDQAPDNNQ